MPFYQYDIRRREDSIRSERVTLYEAIFWAPDEKQAESHMFNSLHFHASMEAGDCEAAYPVSLTVNTSEGGVEFTLPEQPSRGEGSAGARSETTFSWHVGEPETHEMRPDAGSKFLWQIGNLTTPPSEPLKIRPRNLNLHSLRVASGNAELESLGRNESSRAIVNFLLARGDDWAPFTDAELRVWASVNEYEGPLSLIWLREEGYIQINTERSDPRYVTATTVLQVSDSFIRNMFALYGEITR